MTTAQDNLVSYLAAAQKLVPRVAAAVDHIDRERELPSDLFIELADKGFFSLLVPQSLGGAEIDYLEHLRIIETFAYVDASTAWCINQNKVERAALHRTCEMLSQRIRR